MFNLPVRSRAITIERVEQVDSKLIGMREMPDISFITQWNSFQSQPEKAATCSWGSLSQGRSRRRRPCCDLQTTCWWTLASGWPGSSGTSSSIDPPGQLDDFEHLSKLVWADDQHQSYVLLSSLVVMGQTWWHHKGQRFSPRGWAKSSHTELHCNERKVHRKPWFVPSVMCY